MAYHLLEHNRDGGRQLAEILAQSMEQVGNCSDCRTLSEDARCALCANERRNRSQLCVVETPADVQALEQSTGYQGLYFVLLGHLSPLDGVGPEQLGLDALEARLGTDPTRADTDNDGLPDKMEVEGWTFDAAGLTTRVTSDPLLRDGDGDGIYDQAEYTLGFPYHPRVWNSSPIGLYTDLADEDGFVHPGQTFAYTATVRNNFDRPLYAHGDLVVGYPYTLGVSRDMDVTGPVHAIAVSEDGNDVYVGGYFLFQTASGETIVNVARWDRTTETWFPLVALRPLDMQEPIELVVSHNRLCSDRSTGLR